MRRLTFFDGTSCRGPSTGGEECTYGGGEGGLLLFEEVHRKCGRRTPEMDGRVWLGKNTGVSMGPQRGLI